MPMRRWLPGSVGVGVAVLGEEELLRSDAGSQMPSLAPAVRGKTVDEVVRNVAQSAAGLAADRALPLGKHQILNQPWNSGQIQFGSPALANYAFPPGDPAAASDRLHCASGNSVGRLMAHKAHLPWSIKIKKEGITALYD